MINLSLCSHSIHTPAVVVMPAQHSTSKSSTHTTIPVLCPCSRNSFARPQESANAPIDRRRRERSNHLLVSATYYRETDASFTCCSLATARSCMHNSGRAIPKVICSSCRRVQQYISFRHSTFPLGYLVMHFLWTVDMGHGSTKCTRTYHAC